MELRVGVKILLKNKDGKYLVLCRSKIKYPEVGPEWDIAGGRIEPGTTLLQNLKREVMEETGLEITGEPKLVTVQDIIRSQKGKHIVRLTYTGKADGEVKLSDEHSEYKWLLLDEIKKLEPIDQFLKEVLRKFDLK